MRRSLAIALLSIVVALPPAIRAAEPQLPSAVAHADDDGCARHATTGVVKAIDATRLVITRAGKHGGEMTFVLPPSTPRDGLVGVGSTVSIRYHVDGAALVATAMSAQDPRSKAARRKRSDQ